LLTKSNVSAFKTKAIIRDNTRLSLMMALVCQQLINFIDDKSINGWTMSNIAKVTAIKLYVSGHRPHQF